MPSSGHRRTSCRCLGKGSVHVRRRRMVLIHSDSRAFQIALSGVASTQSASARVSATSGASHLRLPTKRRPRRRRTSGPSSAVAWRNLIFRSHQALRHCNAHDTQGVASCEPSGHSVRPTATQPPRPSSGCPLVRHKSCAHAAVRRANSGGVDLGSIRRRSEADSGSVGGRSLVDPRRTPNIFKHSLVGGGDQPRPRGVNHHDRGRQANRIWPTTGRSGRAANNRHNLRRAPPTRPHRRHPSPTSLVALRGGVGQACPLGKPNSLGNAHEADAKRGGPKCGRSRLGVGR